MISDWRSLTFRKRESSYFKSPFAFVCTSTSFLCPPRFYGSNHVVNPYLLRSPFLTECAPRIFLPGTAFALHDSYCHGREHQIVSPSQTIQFCLLATAPSSFRRIKKRLLFKQTLSPLYITRQRDFKLFHFFENFFKKFLRKKNPPGNLIPEGHFLLLFI